MYTLKDLIDYCNANPGKLSYGSADVAEFLVFVPAMWAIPEVHVHVIVMYNNVRLALDLDILNKSATDDGTFSEHPHPLRGHRRVHRERDIRLSGLREPAATGQRG